MGIVKAICISEKKGTPKHEVPEAILIPNHGIEGDAHAGNWHRQISLLAKESVDKMRERIPIELRAGDFAENILTEGIILHELEVGTVLRVGDTEMEVTQIGKECHSDCEIKKQVGICVMPLEGIFCKVLKEGTIQAGDEINIIGSGVC